MTQKELTDRLDKASVLYYNGRQSEFSDTEFDLMLKDLQAMEKASGVVYPNSPTLRVGSDIQSGFGKIAHPSPMLTIENVYNDEDLMRWAEKLSAKYPEALFFVSPKYDGISCEVHYSDGLFVSASTRGDKNVGDDISANVRTIKSVPLSIDAAGDVYVRGEVLMPKSRLAILNEEREASGEAPLANTRNACSGSLKQLDPSVTASRGLIFRAWDCFGDGTPDTMAARMEWLSHRGFAFEDIVFTPAMRLTSEAVGAYRKRMLEYDLDFDCDGVVIKIDRADIQEEIGTRDTRAIEWGIARKWNEDFVTSTRLLGVDWQVGRTGILTPVGRLDPVECAGVIVSNVTLNNIDFIESFDLYIGDTLKITRSGGVIPYVLSAEHPDGFIASDDTGLGGLFSSSEADAGAVKVAGPSTCPACGAPVVRDGAALRCSDPHCPAREKAVLLQFCSKDCMDIRTIGESVVEDLYDTGLVKSLTDIIAVGGISDEDYESTVDKWMWALGSGYGARSVRNLVDGIRDARNRMPYEKVLASLSIPGVGKIMARTIAAGFHTLEAFRNATVEDLVALDGIAELSAGAICQWLAQDDSAAVLDALIANGWHTESSAVSRDLSALPLAGLSICFSGSSQRFSGDDVEDFLESLGARCTHSVSGKLSYLVTGGKPGPSKVKKAAELGVKTLTEEEFYQEFGI